METTTYRSEGEAGEGMRMQQEQAMVEVEKKQMKVMVAIDESEESFHALKWALDHLFFFMPSSSSSAGGVAAAEAELTQNQEHGMVILVHVQQPFHYYIAPAGPVDYATPLVLESVRKSQEENSTILMARALKLCKERQVRAEAMILNGEPKEMICEATEQINPTILVVGSRCLSKIKRAFLGSVSDYCAHHAKCPILIVKPQK
ncbi:universal stress protein A-like protein isoform X1 [Macadamia integrifolia]|uniref:universal stress protein A-like protein isoform X1 n=1 Tax=Macadamia integrifolia TaxID=60698 RepID=UPI001C4E956B|nr:universal stress protein A-like protein isoform X1 [Macadamia integrifolia]